MADSLPIAPSEKNVYSTKAEISQFYSSLEEHTSFLLIDDDVCIDPHDEYNNNNYQYNMFRTKNGGRLNRAIATIDFILVATHKGCISAVLGIPVPPAATLTVKISTWCNWCDDACEVENCPCFGVGMVPYREGKVQRFECDTVHTCIENGIQYNSNMAFDGISRKFITGYSYVRFCQSEQYYDWFTGLLDKVTMRFYFQ
jgi:hypothetical protein